MNISAKIAERKRHEERRHGALSAALAIAQMDPRAREDLITYLKDFNEAKGDDQEQEYLFEAIVEVFQFDGQQDCRDLNAWEQDVAATPDGKAAVAELKKETESFFKIYVRLKGELGLDTIRKVAEAADLSPTTVNAIEKQRVKPQFKTLQALARAFGVDVSVLSGS